MACIGDEVELCGRHECVNALGHQGGAMDGTPFTEEDQ
jgi:hypothetical protein